MKKAIRIMLLPVVIVFILSMIAVFSFAGCKTKEEVEETAEETTAEEVAEPITLVVWFGSEWDAPGLAEYMETIAGIYEERNPGITVEVKPQTQDTVVSEFQAAVAAKDPNIGPDIQYIWDGIWTLEHAWAGNLAPLDEYIPESELSTMLAGNYLWDGKTWAVGFVQANPNIFYNKEYFAQVGVDSPPETWDEFMELCKKLKDAGITPFGWGLRDGWGNGWFPSMFGYSYIDSMEDILRLCADGTWVEQKWIDCFQYIDDMRKLGYFNEDAASVDFLQGWDLFAKGDVAMAIATDAIVNSWVEIMGVDAFDIMPHTPIMGQGKLGDRYAANINAFAIPSWSAHKQEAADFLVYMHTTEMLELFYEMTKVIPPDTKFDPSLIEYPQQETIYQCLISGEKPYTLWMENFYPSQLNLEGWYPAFQKMWMDELDSKGVLEYAQNVLEKWRDQNPQQVEIYRNWELAPGL